LESGRGLRLKRLCGLRLAIRLRFSGRRLGSGCRVLNRNRPLRRTRFGRGVRNQRTRIRRRCPHGSLRHPIARRGRCFCHLRTVSRIPLWRRRARSDRRKINHDGRGRVAWRDCGRSPANDGPHRGGVSKQRERRGGEPAKSACRPSERGRQRARRKSRRGRRRG
jgi:hypothetical protein